VGPSDQSHPVLTLLSHGKYGIATESGESQ